MRQLVQNVSSGEISVEEVPPPMADETSMLIATRASLISAGTERAVVALGNQSLVGKARARPDLVAKVIEGARTEGIGPTVAKVRGRLAEPNPLGYSLAGVVIHACPGAPAAPGELVAAAGAGRASHAEIVSVPRNLCARVPDGVSAADAAYGTVATIALHGFRLAEVGLGDVVAVIGLGLVGQLTMELAASAGCVPVGFDPAPDRVELARKAGFIATSDSTELDTEIHRLTQRRGADGVLVTAASKSSDPLMTAIAVARERAVVSVVGDVAISSPRTPLFAKELRLVVSRSYGPGRYDPGYEERGHDYPAGYVRWTEGRNLAEVLRLMAAGKLNPGRLTTHTFGLEQGPEAYALLSSSEPSLGILLSYKETTHTNGGPHAVELPAAGRRRHAIARHRPRIGVIGAGAFARSVLIPKLQQGADVVAIANATGASARATAERVGAGRATTDVDELLSDAAVDAVLIATRHDTHANYVARALNAGKHVFVEKPLALDDVQLRAVETAARDAGRVLMVGFNRRYAPSATALKQALGGRGPLLITYRVSAGRLPAAHWTRDPQIGGGRIVGEVCHFVDFATFLAGAAPVAVTAAAASGSSEPREDNVAAVLQFADGSVASITYASLGDAAMPKEHIEVMGEHGAAALDDFRKLTLYVGGAKRDQGSKRDKGHGVEMSRFVEACRSGVSPQPLAEAAAVMRTTFEIRDRIAAPLA
jgi:predicted dehydrogenase/threonine dehydrogenase-like Zn-dependent dehydrogenase